MTNTGADFRLLVLGGTSWLGGEIARGALERGHRVSCLARGDSGQPPEGVGWIKADRWRPGAYDDVATEWDAVVDVSWQPELVRSALTALAPLARHWVYVSSCSAYADDSTPGADESAAVHLPWPGAGEAGADDYGPAKVACEAACRDQLGPDRVLVARVGLIAGYGDRSDRFGYWPARLARVLRAGEEVLVPDITGTAVQVVDVNDLASWLLDCAETQAGGTLNATGDQATFDEVLATCAGATRSEPSYVAADPQWLLEQRVAPWSGAGSLPLWLPMPAYAGFMRRSNAAAKASGLRLRPLAETVAASLRWERELGLARDRRAGLTADREAELLTSWRDK